MGTGALTGYVDAAQVTLYAFWAFFAGLIYYLRREDKREGYPMEPDGLEMNQRGVVQGFPAVPPPKTFRLHDGYVLHAPQTEPPSPPTNAVPAAMWPGAPLMPTGNPMIDGLGPASWVDRRDIPDMTYKGHERILPLRIMTQYGVEEGGLDPRGMNVLGADWVVAGFVADLWIDVTEKSLRYLEVELTLSPERPHVLLPEVFVRFQRRQRRVMVRSILGAQFIDVPRLRDPDKVTFREEDRIVAYYGGGSLYATPARLGPLI